MPEVPVDLTGIIVGQTLIWDGTKLIPANRTAGSAPRTAETVDELGIGAFDGEQAIIRVGTYPNIHEEPISWNVDQDRWIGLEHVLVTQGDTWSMDLGNRSQSQMEAWSPIDNPNPFGHSYGTLQSALNLSDSSFNPGTATGVITLESTDSPHSYPFSDGSTASGNHGAPIRVRDNYITHTGKTSTTLTGCAVVQGSRGTIPAGEKVKQGYPGGWGFSAVSLSFVSDLIAAGLGIQERMMSLCNNGVGASDVEKQLDIAPYWFQYDVGEGTALPTIPPTGGLGFSAILNPPVGSAGPLGTDEREFYVSSNQWTDWPLMAPTKQFLIPRICGKLASGVVTSGEVLDTRLAVRWASEVLV